MDRIELRSELTRYNDRNGTDYPFRYVDTGTIHYQGRTLRGRIHTEHKERWSKEGVYVVQIFDQEGDRLDIIKGSTVQEWTPSQLTQILATAVSTAQAEIDEHLEGAWGVKLA